jgi:hypothetical protein
VSFALAAARSGNQKRSEEMMDAATIFVLCLAAGFVIFVVYLAIASRRFRTTVRDANDRKSGDKRRMSSQNRLHGSGIVHYR